MSPYQIHYPRQRGFTLIEIAITLVLFGILGIAGSELFTASVKTNQSISNANMAYASAQYAMERMSREIREMDNTGSLQISSSLSQSDTLTFKKPDPQDSTGVNKITVNFAFSLQANGLRTLKMGYGDAIPIYTLASNLTEGSFSYYSTIDASTTPPTVVTATTPETLNYVLVRLTVKPDLKVFTLSNLIYLRNT